MGKETMGKKEVRAALIGLSLAVLCLSGCKTRSDPIPDPYRIQDNPLVGVWKAGGAYYVFREDGTGGIGGAEPLGDEFSFLFWRGRGLGVAASAGINHLVRVGGDTSTAAAATVKRYTALENGGFTLEAAGEAPLTLSRESGSARPLSLDNPFIGEWHATWNGVHGEESRWSFKFREDGTVRAYHHGMHQFDNAYLVRGKVMALLGEWRFDGAFGLKYMTFTVEDGDHITAQEEPADNAPGLSWDFRRVEAAVWK